jgi:hypothetical protein
MAADVIANLYGGLGNQLFQLAAALHARRAIGGASYDLLLLEGHRDSLDIGEFVDVTMRRPKRLDRAQWIEFAQERSPLNIVFRPSARVHERLTRRVLVKQSSPFDGVPDLPRGGRVKLEGFFQNPEWFDDSWREVVQVLLDAAPTGFAELRAERRCTVHVRRRDYVPAGWDMGPEYYRVSMEALGIRDCEVTVVSDEPGFVPWFTDALRPLGCTAVPARPMTGAAIVDDFWNVAAAGALVAANSTFSWWAAAVATVLDPRTPIAYPTPWIVNRWNRRPLPDLGLPGWTSFPSGLPEFG